MDEDTVDEDTREEDTREEDTREMETDTHTKVAYRRFVQYHS